MVDKLLAAVRMAGLRPQGIDLSAFAMIRALHRPGGDGATLYMSVGGMTNLAIAEGTTCVFTRVVPTEPSRWPPSWRSDAGSHSSMRTAG